MNDVANRFQQHVNQLFLVSEDLGQSLVRWYFIDLHRYIKTSSHWFQSTSPLVANGSFITKNNMYSTSESWFKKARDSYKNSDHMAALQFSMSFVNVIWLSPQKMELAIFNWKRKISLFRFMNNIPYNIYDSIIIIIISHI